MSAVTTILDDFLPPQHFLSHQYFNKTINDLALCNPDSMCHAIKPINNPHLLQGLIQEHFNVILHELPHNELSFLLSSLLVFLLIDFMFLRSASHMVTEDPNSWVMRMYNLVHGKPHPWQCIHLMQHVLSSKNNFRVSYMTCVNIDVCLMPH